MTHIVCISALVLVLCVPSQITDSTQPSDFQLGPNGEHCMKRSNIHQRFYDHTDQNGQHCLCELCSHGNVLKNNCTCDPKLLDIPQVSECELVPQGQFMNSSNFCSRGFDCKKCPHPLRVKQTCSPHGPDTVCSCADGYHMTSPETCLPIPKCDTGFEPTTGHGAHRTEIKCTPCRRGYFQPNNNSSRRCKKIRQCTVQEGNSSSDAVCLNDQTPQHEHPADDYVTTQTLATKEFTETHRPVTSPIPKPEKDEITTSGSTTHPIPNSLDVLYSGSYLMWAFLIHIPYTILGFVLAIIFSNFRGVRSFLRSYCNLMTMWNSLRQRGTHYVSPQESGEIKYPVDEMEGVVEQGV